MGAAGAAAERSKYSLVFLQHSAKKGAGLTIALIRLHRSIEHSHKGSHPGLGQRRLHHLLRGTLGDLGVQQRDPICEACERGVYGGYEARWGVLRAGLRLRTKEEKLAQMLATVKDIDGVKCLDASHPLVPALLQTLLAPVQVSAVVAGAKDELTKLPLLAAARALVVLAASTHDGEGHGTCTQLHSWHRLLPSLERRQQSRATQA